MQGDIVAQGFELMLYGMGTVVLFLSLLVVATSAMSRLMIRYFPDPEPPAVPAREPAGGAVSAGTDPRLLAVITAAIHRHRRHRK